MSQQWGPSGGGFGGQYGDRFGAPPGYGGGYRPAPRPPAYGSGWSPVPQAPGPRPPRRRSPLQRVFLVMVGLAVLALIGLVVTNLSVGGDNDDVAYQNANYQPPPPDKNPPPLPQPETVGEAQQLIEQNAFYDQTVPLPTRCETKPIDLDQTSDAALKTHLENLMGCLMAVWHSPVEDAKWTLVRPTVTIYSDSITTKCGKSGINAFYCAADQQVYFSDRLADGVPAVKKTPYGPDLVIAHEFGHALQARTGILISAKALGQESGDEATDLQYSRDLETQADCFSGMYLRSVAQSQGITQSDVPDIEATYQAIGDDTLSGKPNIVGNHGLGRSRVYWGRTGLGTSAVGKCNTFTASPSLTR